MSIDDYRQHIDEIAADTTLSAAARDTSLHLAACEIDRALWNDWAKREASELSARARSLMSAESTLEGLDELAARGLLHARG